MLSFCFLIKWPLTRMLCLNTAMTTGTGTVMTTDTHARVDH